MTLTPTPYQTLSHHLKHLRLSHMLIGWQHLEQKATQEHWSYARMALS